MSLPGIIIGAGIGGVAVALALRNAGIEVKLFERSAEPRELGAGLTIWSNAIKAIERLGLRREFDAISCPTNASLFDSDGNLLMDGGTLGAEFAPVATVVHRAELLQMLIDAYGRENIRYGAKCIGVEQDENGIKAKFEDGTKLDGAFLIGADGLHSVVRSALFGEANPTYAGYTAWRAILKYDCSDYPTGETWGPGGRFGYIPMTEGRLLWFATKNTPERSGTTSGEKDELLRLFANWHHPIKEIIEQTDESAILRNDVYDQSPLPSWICGRITLIGDAAHPIVPVIGQGACLALEDAVVLAQSLQKYPDAKTAFVHYEDRRLARANFFVRHARIVGKMGQFRSPAFVTIRNLLVRQVFGKMEAEVVRKMLTVDLN